MSLKFRSSHPDSAHVIANFGIGTLPRKDHLYDVIVEVDHNTRPRIAGRGSAVFIHLARPGLAPTAGCVALDGKRLRWLVGRLNRRTTIDIA